MLKQNILICGTSDYDTTKLFSAATPAGTIPENTDEDIEPSGQEDAASEENDGKQKTLVRRFVETPLANFIEANDLSELGEEGDFPKNLSMGDYVRKVEAELHADGRFDGDTKIDTVWFCAREAAFMSNAEKDFVRSAAGVPNALIVASPTIILKRPDFKKEIDTLTGVAGSHRVVIAPDASSGEFMAMSSGTLSLIGRTVYLFLSSVDAPEEEKTAYDNAWADFYKERFDKWLEEQDENLGTCIEKAAGRANFILNKPVNASLADLVEEGVGLLGELVEILRGNTEVERKPGKTDLAHIPELKENIELMIYEIAACYGHAATEKDVDDILRHSRTSTLPKDAAAVTYAVGQVAKAVLEPVTEYTSKEVLAIYREAKEEAMGMEFAPFDDDNPFAGLEGDYELSDEDCEEHGEETDETGDDGTEDEGEGSSDVHEPEDELPDDCRVDDNLNPSND